MAYVTADGSVVENPPFNIFGWFWDTLNFFYLFFQTLFNPNYSKHGNKYVQDFRPPSDGGPPRPPTRKYGGFGPSGSGPPPPPMGGCGCG